MITKENLSILKPEQSFFIGNVKPGYETETNPKKSSSTTDALLLANKRKNIQDSVKLHANVSPRLMADLGKINGDRGKTNAAKKAFNTAIAQNPKNINIRMKYVDTLIKLKRFDDAIDQITYTEKLVSKDSRISIKRLQILLDLSYEDKYSHYVQDFSVAIDAYIKDFKDDYRAYNFLGLYQALILKDISKAKRSFQSSLNIEDNYPALTNMGNCYWELDDLQKAEKYFREAINHEQKEELAHINLINLFIQEKNYEAALDHINESEEYISSSGASYVYQKGWLLLKNNQVEDALEWNLSVLEGHPDNFKLYNNIGNCYEKLGKVDEAFRYYFKSIQLSKKLELPAEDLKQYYNALLLASSQNDNERSVRISEQLLEVDKYNLPALYTIANVKLRNKKFEDAKLDFKKIIKLDPTSHDAYVSLSFIYTEIDGNYEDAILLLEGADLIVDKKGEGDGYYNNLAYAYIKSNLLEEAEDALIKTTGSAHSLSTKALLHLYRGDESKYDSVFKQSLKKFRDVDAKLALQSYHFEKALYKANNSSTKTESLKLLDKVIDIDKSSYFSDKAQSLKDKII